MLFLNTSVYVHDGPDTRGQGLYSVGQTDSVWNMDVTHQCETNTALRVKNLAASTISPSFCTNNKFGTASDTLPVVSMFATHIRFSFRECVLVLTVAGSRSG